ncbi:HipA domain-containing protein [Vibrio parahaemolyticus]|uniref:HipA domain-containing protein n=1 Tax=Vibrio parahaemolyticus TaxID=670 RepID=UPI001123A832|nr:HipA domain-containing protein [Vibrio parahaemolyticus]TOD58118.1 hypothetical protein CGJ61_23440 [Vibrio parahaemolyticus]
MIQIDVSSWVADEQHGIFPVGARDKQMLWSPNDASGDICPSWPYLFKESIPRYPDQYWTEVVAYIIGGYLGVDVPKALPATRTDEDQKVIEGALIEWFYDGETERYMAGGVFFKRLIPDFDDKLGQHHNIKDFLTILRTLRTSAKLQDDIYKWLADMALFDCLIGNTDRHQENWGVIFRAKNCVMAPLFDNGTSMGHERFVRHIANWNEDQYANYLAKGNHHLRFSRKDLETRIPHSTLIDMVSVREGIHEYLVERVENFEVNIHDLEKDLLALTEIPSQTPFTLDRCNWMMSLLRRRLKKIKEVLK